MVIVLGLVNICTEQDNVHFVCPVCTNAADTAQNTSISNVTSRPHEYTHLSTVNSASIPSQSV